MESHPQTFRARDHDHAHRAQKLAQFRQLELQQRKSGTWFCYSWMRLQFDFMTLAQIDSVVNRQFSF
jgi:hypothetical protein